MVAIKLHCHSLQQLHIRNYNVLPHCCRSTQKKLHGKGDGVAYSSLLDVIVGCGDMVLLDPPNEDKVVENLKLRYSKKDIYVRQLVAIECARKTFNRPINNLLVMA